MAIKRRKIRRNVGLRYTDFEATAPPSFLAGEKRASLAAGSVQVTTLLGEIEYYQYYQ
jgi:hypothetical protein